MRTVIKTIDDCAEAVQLNCTPVEWLIINKALRQFAAIYQIANVDSNFKSDVKIAESMLAVKPIFCEKMNGGDRE